MTGQFSVLYVFVSFAIGKKYYAHILLPEHFILLQIHIVGMHINNIGNMRFPYNGKCSVERYADYERYYY